MTDRNELIRRFLQRSGWECADFTPMTADASFRTYARVRDLAQTPSTAVLMNTPPDQNNPVTEFTNVAEILGRHGYSAPEIYARDVENGLLLIEDLGDDLFADLCRVQPDCEVRLYEAAVDLLADLSGRNAPKGLPRYSTEVLLKEALLLQDWYLPAATGEKPDDTKRAGYSALITDACTAVQQVRPVLVCRDFHAENLLWLPQRSGLARVGLLDFQDALAGHPAYDLVSLLEDARRDTSELLRKDMYARFLAATRFDPLAFEQAYCTFGAQRNLKIIGIFARLGLRDGKMGYLDLMPRVWDHLMRDLSHPALTPLRTWVLDHVPAPTPAVRSAIREFKHDA